MPEYEKFGPVMALTPSIKRKIASWKPRIYKRYRTIKEFIAPLLISKSRFSQWISGRNAPPVKYYNLIEGALKSLGI